MRASRVLAARHLAATTTTATTQCAPALSRAFSDKLVYPEVRCCCILLCTCRCYNPTALLSAARAHTPRRAASSHRISHSSPSAASRSLLCLLEHATLSGDRNNFMRVK
jgi:hypothetical protein